VADISWLRDEDADEALPPGVLLSSGDGLAVVTLRGRHVYWNDAAEELLKVPREKALGSLLADISTTPETREANWGHHITTVGAHLSGNPPVRRVLSTRDYEGTPVRVHISSVLVTLEHQLPLVLYSFTVEHLRDGEEPAYQPPLGLTAREWEVSCLLMSGLGTSEIAQELSIAYATVRAHIRNILVALDANTRTQALMRLWSRYGTPEMAEFPTITPHPPRI
jgi:DNA-binding CsgD family transcriptional regulator